MAGNGVFGARPIAAKAMGVDRKQTGFEHVTHVPADALGLKIGDCGRGGTGCKLYASAPVGIAAASPIPLK